MNDLSVSIWTNTIGHHGKSPWFHDVCVDKRQVLGYIAHKKTHLKPIKKPGCRTSYFYIDSYESYGGELGRMCVATLKSTLEGYVPLKIIVSKDA